MNGLVPLATQLVRLSLTDPRAAARRVIDIGRGFAPAELWLALILMTVLSTLLTYLSMSMVLPAGQDAGLFGMGPIAMAGLQQGIMAGFVWAIVAVGRWAGGRGDLIGALSVVVWLELLALILQAAQVVLTPFGPGGADLVGLIGLVLFWTLLSFFVAELHGFKSVPLVFGGIALTVVAAAFALTIVLMLAGVRLDL